MGSATGVFFEVNFLARLFEMVVIFRDNLLSCISTSFVTDFTRGDNFLPHFVTDFIEEMPFSVTLFYYDCDVFFTKVVTIVDSSVIYFVS